MPDETPNPDDFVPAPQPDILAPVLSSDEQSRAQNTPRRAPLFAPVVNMARRVKNASQRAARRRFVKPLAASAGLLGWSGICFVLGWGVWASSGLPDTSGMWTEKRPASVTILDRYNQPILVRGSRPTRPVNLAALPDHLPDALQAVEDRRYRYHPGFDLKGLARAFAANYKAGRVVQGGSTLSQQLAKNLFLTPERSLKRKSQEMLLALWLEHKFTKTQILELYLGRVYFGSGAWGIDAAAERYFAKPAADLTLGEAAMLAGLLKAPSSYNPASSPQRASARTTTVLQAMTDTHFITQAQANAAYAEPIIVEAPDVLTSAHYFVDWIWDELIAHIGGEPSTDIFVRTTLDLHAQQAADKAFAEHLNPARGARQAAMVAMDGTGGVRVMSGGLDYSASQFNRAISARRQPGSAFKPFVYLAAIRAGVRPWSVRTDEPIIIDDWEPSNFSNEFMGRVSVMQAFQKSLNTIAVVLSEEVGREAVVQTASAFGLKDLQPLRSIALGAQEVTPFELTQAYLPFANWGYSASGYGIDSIHDAKGQQIYRHSQTQGTRVVQADALRDMNLLMHSVVEGGTGRAARIAGRELAGKTGTTNDYRDAWFMGYGPDLVAGVWVGDDDYEPMAKITGGSIPARIWHDVMETALRDMPAAPLPKSVQPITIAKNEAMDRLLSDVEIGLD